MDSEAHTHSMAPETKEKDYWPALENLENRGEHKKENVKISETIRTYSGACFEIDHPAF